MSPLSRLASCRTLCVRLRPNTWIASFAASGFTPTLDRAVRLGPVSFEHCIAPCAEVYCSAKDVALSGGSSDCWATLLGAHLVGARHAGCIKAPQLRFKSGGGPFAGLWLGSGSVTEQKQEQGKNDFRILRGFRRRHQPQVATEFSSPGCAGVHQNRQGRL